MTFTLQIRRLSVVPAHTLGICLLLTVATGCGGDLSAELQRRCDLVAKGIEPGSGHRFGRVIDPYTVDSEDVPERINDVLDAWSNEILQIKAKEPQHRFTSEEYDAILARAAAKFDLKNPDCRAWSGYIEKAEMSDLLAKNIQPFCEEYETVRKADTTAESTREGHERAVQLAAKAWKATGGWPVEAVAVVDKLTAMSTIERSLQLGPQLMLYVQAPVIPYVCETMVKDAEYVGGLE